MSDDQFPAPFKHGRLEEIFRDIFLVTGAVKMAGTPFQFSRNMTVVRDGGDLVLINTVRLDDEGIRALTSLGTVKHVIRIGANHGMDDPFYVSKFNASFWSLPGLSHNLGLTPSVEIGESTELPIPESSLFVFKTGTLPEGIIRLDRDDGILISCDCLQNWEKSDTYFNLFSKIMMPIVGFIKPTNIGPGWLKMFKPKNDDFQRFLKLEYQHVIPAHGTPVRGQAQSKYRKRIEQQLGIKQS